MYYDLSASFSQSFLASSTPLVTLTLIDFKGLNKAWAFQKMGSGRLLLRNAPGLRFWKLLGTGEGIGFSVKPNFGKYGFFGVWESKAEADNFLQNSSFIHQYQRHSEEINTLKLIPVQAKGLWSGQNPFSPAFEDFQEGGRVVVLTRASIRWTRLKRFWEHVPSTSEELAKAEGLYYSIGLGEAPLIHQATLSIWENHEAMKHFAYHSPVHKEVIQKTRAENWYSEDLFARFLVLESDL